MSGVHVDINSPQADHHDKAPILDKRQQAVVRKLVRRRRPLVGGIKIVGPIVGKGGTVGVGTETSGTLGVLLEDANFPDVAYGITSLHVLEEGAHGAGLTLKLGHSVFQPTQTGKGIFSGISRIGWLIAMYKEFDLALIGVRPGMRWKPQIQEIGETHGGKPFLDDFTSAQQTGSPGPRTVQMWSFEPEPVLGSLPSSGPVVHKVGQRTGLTSGRAYRSVGATAKYKTVPKPKGDGSSRTNIKAWALLKHRYLRDPLLADSVPHASAIDPVLYLCVPDQVGSSTDLTTFQQTGDSGSALVDDSGMVVGIVQDVVRDRPTTTMAKKWIAGLALPIDLVLGTLQEAIDREYGKTGSPPDWPALQVPDAPLGAPKRRVPKRPQPPKWYQLALSRIRAAKP